MRFEIKGGIMLYYVPLMNKFIAGEAGFMPKNKAELRMFLSIYAKIKSDGVLARFGVGLTTIIKDRYVIVAAPGGELRAVPPSHHPQIIFTLENLMTVKSTVNREEGNMNNKKIKLKQAYIEFTDLGNAVQVKSFKNIISVSKLPKEIQDAYRNSDVYFTLTRQNNLIIVSGGVEIYEINTGDILSKEEFEDIKALLKEAGEILSMLIKAYNKGELTSTFKFYI